MEETIKQHIEITPGVCGGKPRIKGRRIRVQDIAMLREVDGLTPEEIADEYPTITKADVHAALAYYDEHTELIKRQMAEDAAYVEELRAKTPSVLAAKLRKRNAENDSIPSG